MTRFPPPDPPESGQWPPQPPPRPRPQRPDWAPSANPRGFSQEQLAALEQQYALRAGLMPWKPFDGDASPVR
jgi:hypothetical protein